MRPGLPLNETLADAHNVLLAHYMSYFPSYAMMIFFVQLLGLEVAWALQRRVVVERLQEQ